MGSPKGAQGGGTEGRDECCVRLCVGSGPYLMHARAADRLSPARFRVEGRPRTGITRRRWPAPALLGPDDGVSAHVCLAA